MLQLLEKTEYEKVAYRSLKLSEFFDGSAIDLPNWDTKKLIESVTCGAIVNWEVVLGSRDDPSQDADDVNGFRGALKKFKADCEALGLWSYRYKVNRLCEPD